MGPKKKQDFCRLVRECFRQISHHMYSVLFLKKEDIGYLVVRPKLVLFSAINTDCLKSYFSFYDDVKKDLLYDKLYNFWISF